MKKKLWGWLLFLTNNEEVSRYEKEFDAGFFIVATLSWAIAFPLFILAAVRHGDLESAAWAFVINYLYIEQWDELRHNREGD